MEKPKKNSSVKLSVAAITNMRTHSERVVTFCVSCMQDLVLEDNLDLSLISAYAEAIYVNQKFAEYLEGIEEQRPKLRDEKTKKDKYVLDVQDILMMEALVNVKMSVSEAFPTRTGGRSLEVH